MRSLIFALWSFFLILNAESTHAQRMPRENVVETPAISEGLCVSNLFQSGMVLQRGKPISIWGWGKPGAELSVEFAEYSVSVEVADDRSWKVNLPACEATASPQALSVTSGGDSLQLTDILIGDVWVLGGQSNMEFELAKVENGNLEIASANYPQMRLLTVPQGVGPEPKRSFERLHEWSGWFGRHFRKGNWEHCTPESARELSAIGFVFARRVHQASQVPIGVIDISRGGTTVEAWTPLEALRKLESQPLQAKLASMDVKVAEWDSERDLADRIKKHEQWLEKQAKENKVVPEDRKAAPTDLRPGPIADQNYPGNCYAGMLAPLAGLSVKGAIFHQGYNNAFDFSRGAEMYRDVFPEMIRSWRAAFNDPELPFGILSLCTDGYPQTRDDYCEKMFNAGMEIREAQYQTFLSLYDSGDKNVGFASSYDLRRRWYHPQLKVPAGERLARWALATQYGFNRQLEWKPPQIIAMKTADNALHVVFDADVGDPGDGSMEGFAICGKDRQFHPANVAYFEKGKDARGRPQLDRRTLVLTSPMVNSPIHYRFAWGRNPLANLQKTGHKDLPIATQRSDNWKMQEVPLGVVENPSSELSRADRGKILQALRAQDQARQIRNAELILESEGK